MVFVDLELNLRHDDADTYSVEACLRLPHSAADIQPIQGSRPQVAFDLDALVLHELDPKTYGMTLSDMLFADTRIVNAFAQARAAAESQGIPLRVRLRLDAADDMIHSLRWETLWDSECGGFLFNSERVLFSRYLDSIDFTPIVRRPCHELRALVVVAHPIGLDAYNLASVDVAGEVSRCRKALNSIHISVLARELGEKAASMTNISAALREEPDILYLVAHGTSSKGKSILWLEDDDGSIARIEGDRFAQQLVNMSCRPLLVVLVSCQSMGTSHDAGTLAAIGPRLASAGVAAVIAMQGDVTMETVVRCMPLFFRELRRDGQIDRALAAARSAVLNRPDWWAPVLFLRVRDGMLWSAPTAVLSTLERPAEPDLPPEVDAFIGREADLAYFTETLVSRHFAIITGMPGVGKTTLAAMLAHQVADPAKTFWHSFEKQEDVYYLARKLAEFLAWHGQDAIWNLLNSSRQSTDRPLPTKDLIDRLLQMLRGQGYTLCFDDFQFIDKDDDPDLTHLMQQLRNEVLAGNFSLIITSWRGPPAFVPKFQFKSLAGLDADDIRHLLKKHDLSLSEDLVIRLADLTRGNAQLLMLTVNALAYSPNPASLIDELSETGDTDTESIETVLSTRVNEILTQDQRAVMTAMAVLQGSGSRDALEATLNIRGSMQRPLHDLLSCNLLIKAGRQYGQHAIVRAYYYNQLERLERQAMHRRAGTYYEAEEPDALKAARHFVWAGEFARARKLITGNFWTLMNQGQVRILRQVLEQFTARQMDTEQWIEVSIARAEVNTLLGESQVAWDCYNEAIANLETLPNTPAVRERKARVYRGMALVSLRTGTYDQADAECRNGLELVMSLGLPNLEAARLYTQLAEVLMRRSDFVGAEQACRDGLTALPPVPAAPRERVTLLQRLATLDGQRGKYAGAIHALEQSLALSRQIRDPALTALVLHNLGIYCYHLGQNDRALEAFQESLRLKELIGDTAGRVKTINALGACYIARGEYDAALSCYLECRDLSERLTMPRSLAGAAINISILHFIQGRLNESIQSLEQARIIYHSLDDVSLLASCLYRLGDIMLAQHEPIVAQDAGEQSLALAQRVGSKAYESCAQRVIGEALLAQGRLDEATEHLNQAWQLQEQIGDRSDKVLILAAQAQLAMAHGERIQAATHVQAGLVLARESRVPYLITLLEALCKEIERCHTPVGLHRTEAAG